MNSCLILLQKPPTFDLSVVLIRHLLESLKILALPNLWKLFGIIIIIPKFATSLYKSFAFVETRCTHIIFMMQDGFFKVLYLFFYTCISYCNHGQGASR